MPIMIGVTTTVVAETSTPPVAEWPFRFHDNLIWVEVRVDDSQPLRFILDSASTQHVISSAAVHRLGLSESEESLLVRRTDSVQEEPMTTAVNLNIGGFVVKNTPLLILPLDGIDGILGLPLFERYVVQVDFGGSKIRLFERKATFSAREEGNPIPLRVSDGLMGIQLSDSTGKPGLFVLDTGCSSGVLMGRHASKKFGFCKGCGAEAHVLYASGKIQSQRFAKTHWQIGALATQSVETVVCTEGSKGLLADRRWAGIAGNGLLSKFKVTFDLPRQRVYLESAQR